VTVELANGETASFDPLAGFDGIRSSIRKHLVGRSAQ
jgi:2-polyprenyl-6-methoxyphenol hydroxylase-like FAD-dependent oxidoreductase